MMQDGTRNSPRFAFVDTLEQWTATQPDPSLPPVVLPWLVSSKRSTIESIHKPEPDDQVLFISLALKHGSIQFLTQT